MSVFIEQLGISNLTVFNLNLIESVWDSDMAALLLLVYLLPPPPSGKKRAVKITVREALSHVVQFHKVSGPNFELSVYVLY